MANVLNSIPPKKGGVWPSFLRAKKILALVPKLCRKSSDDESITKSDDKILAFPSQHDDSSPAPSLPSSMENLKLLSDDDIAPVQDEVTASPLEMSPKTPVQSVPDLPQSPASATPVTDTSGRPRVSRRPRFVVLRPRPVRVRMQPLEFRWARHQFQHRAKIDASYPETQNPKTPFKYFTSFVTDDILDFKTDPASSIVYFDNYFTSLELLSYLREEMGIFSLGTIRSNRLRGAETKLISDKELKKKPRGSYSQVVCNKNKVCVVKWYDNKSVTTASSYIDAHPMSTIRRYDEDQKRKTDVPCPELIKHYNAHMGGVDLADMLIALYRTEIKAHRWYLPLVSQILDICVTNSWLLHRRDNKSNTISLKKFRYSIIQGLLYHQRPNSTHTKNVVGLSPSKIIRVPVAKRPPTEVRYDQLGYFPIFDIKGRCKLYTKGQTTVACSKCNVRLCLVADRNCFVFFHT